MKWLPQITTINILLNKNYLIESCFLYLINIPHIFLYILFLGKSCMSCVKTTHLINYESLIYLLNVLVYYLTGYLFHLFDFEYGYTNWKLVYINKTAHTLITMGNHAFLYFKNKRKKKFLHVSNKIFELKTCSFSVQCRQMKKLCVFVNHKIKSVELPSQTNIFAHATTSKRE